MSNYNSAYANYKQYNNSDISKHWNYDMQPIPAPVISTIKTNVFGTGPNTGVEHPTLKNAYRFYPKKTANKTTADVVLRSACGGRPISEDYDSESLPLDSGGCSGVCDPSFPTSCGSKCICVTVPKPLGKCMDKNTVARLAENRARFDTRENYDFNK